MKWPRPGLKINCGGGDSFGFQPDIAYNGGTTASTKDVIDVKTPNAAHAPIYQTERSGDFTYTIPVYPVPGGYTIRMHFAEFKFAMAGQRKFNVDVNGTPVLSNFDIFAEAGAKDKALVKDFPHIAGGTDGKITIRFYKGAADDAKVDGIEIIPPAS